MRVMPWVSLSILVLGCVASAQETRVGQQSRTGAVGASTRLVSKTYPVNGAAAQVSISNQFGAVRVIPWDQPVIRVNAEIRVSAGNPQRAERFAQAIEVAGNNVGDLFEVVTRYPPVQRGESMGYTTDLEISLPATASLVIENTFGDVSVSGLEGDLTLDVRFGIVELRNLSGEVRVRAKGQFPLIADGLAKGGTFVLRSTEARFSRLTGDVHVDNYLGAVDVRDLLDALTLDITCESGEVHVYLDGDTLPDIEATADFGEVHSDMLLDTLRWGDTMTATYRNPDADQRLDISSSFGDVYIHQLGLAPSVEPLVQPDSAPIQETYHRSYEAPASGAVHLQAIAGDISLEGYDGNAVEVSVRKFVRVGDVANAQLALEGLALRAEFGDDRLVLQTLTQEDMDTIGCSEYRMDLTVRVPRDAEVHLVADDGTTRVVDLLADVTIEQQAGEIYVRNAQGAVRVTLENGSIETADTAGPLNLTAHSGGVTVLRPFGDVTVVCRGGNTVIDTPRAGLHARSSQGDVRVIALGGVHSDFDVETEDGNISIALPEDASALFVVNSYGGSIYSSVPITGTSERDQHFFQGRLNEGAYRIFLESRRGNIVIN